MTVLEVTNLSKAYGDVQVLDDLSLSVEEEGQIVGILGPNGIGKTTLLEILTAQQPPDSGEVSVLSYDLPKDSTALKFEIGVLPEKEAPPSFLTAREYLTFVGKDRGMSEEDIDERIEYWSEVLQFSEVLDVLGSDLSRGQQQKVMISQAFLHEPELVFIDEPLANLDPIIQSIFVNELLEYTEEGNTILVSTHQVDFALDVCSELHLFPRSEKNHQILTDVDELTQEQVISMLSGGDEDDS